MTTLDKVRQAASSLGRCARELQQHVTLDDPRLHYERVIGVGIAHDWLTWARRPSVLPQDRNPSTRSYSTVELTRFTFLWTAANALFARDAVLGLLEPSSIPAQGEFSRFLILYKHAVLPASYEAGALGTLHSLLSLPVHVREFPWAVLNRPPTLLETIYHKYTVASEQRRGIGRRIRLAIASGTYENLDLPTLIYATRNWHVHGVLLSSSFRGTRKKFNTWIDTINSALANVLASVTGALANRAHDLVNGRGDR